MLKVGRRPCVAALLAVSSLGWISTQALARVEETNPSVSYTVGWSQGDTSRTWSGGTAAVSSAPGAQATITFTGTSVSWIGGRTPQTGIARVFLDGSLLAEVDTYSKTEEIRVPMFAATGLADASHTFTIEVTGRQNASATGALVVVDAFDVPAATISRLQETDPSVAYTAGWVQDNPVVTVIPSITHGFTQGNSLRSWSAGAALVSTTPGAQVTFTFTGTAIDWIGARGTQSGIARIFLDGAFVEDFDTYFRTEGPQHTDFSVSGLAPGTHTLTIQVMNDKNLLSTDRWILIDAFDVTP